MTTHHRGNNQRMNKGSFKSWLMLDPIQSATKVCIDWSFENHFYIVRKEHHNTNESNHWLCGKGTWLTCNCLAVVYSQCALSWEQYGYKKWTTMEYFTISSCAVELRERNVTKQKGDDEDGQSFGNRSSDRSHRALMNNKWDLLLSASASAAYAAVYNSPSWFVPFVIQFCLVGIYYSWKIASSAHTSRVNNTNEKRIDDREKKGHRRAGTNARPATHIHT